MGKPWKGQSGAKAQEMSAPKAPAAPTASPAQPDLPVARELLGETVIVRMPQLIGGQNEHAAIVTCAHDDGAVNVMLIPATGEAYPIEGVLPASSGATLHWRYRL